MVGFWGSRRKTDDCLRAHALHPTRVRCATGFGGEDVAETGVRCWGSQHAVVEGVKKNFARSGGGAEKEKEKEKVRGRGRGRGGEPAVGLAASLHASIRWGRSRVLHRTEHRAAYHGKSIWRFDANACMIRHIPIGRSVRCCKSAAFFASHRPSNSCSAAEEQTCVVDGGPTRMSHRFGI